MKAMVFAAGLGTRLRPLTDNCPKALVKVGGREMLDRVIDRLAEAGVSEIVVNVHHHADQIKDFLARRRVHGVNIEVSDESDELLDTGGGVMKARKYLDGDGPFIVHNADILTDFDLREMVERHVETGAYATLLVADRPTSRYLLFEPDCLKMRGWENVKTGEVKPGALDKANLVSLAFGGVHVLSPAIFNSLEEYSRVPKFSITPFYIDSCNNMDIRGYMPGGKYMWHDIGSLEKLRAAEADVMSL